MIRWQFNEGSNPSVHSVEIDGVLYKPDVLIERVIEWNQAVTDLAQIRAAVEEVISITTEKHGTAYSKLGRIRALLRRFDHAT